MAGLRTAKRYSQFASLHSALQPHVVHLPSLPGKRPLLHTLVVLQGSSDVAAVQEWRQQMEGYLQRLVNDPVCFTSEEMTQFLAVTKHPQTLFGIVGNDSFTILKVTRSPHVTSDTKWEAFERNNTVLLMDVLQHAALVYDVFGQDTQWVDRISDSSALVKDIDTQQAMLLLDHSGNVNPHVTAVMGLQLPIDPTAPLPVWHCPAQESPDHSPSEVCAELKDMAKEVRMRGVRQLVCVADSLEAEVEVEAELDVGLLCVRWHTDTDNTKFVAKHIHSETARALVSYDVLHEAVATLRAVSRHDSVVPYRHAILTHRARNAWLVMDLVRGGSLQQLLLYRKLSESDIGYIARCLFEGLWHGHQCGVVHGGVRLTDVLVSPTGHVMLAGWHRTVLVSLLPPSPPALFVSSSHSQSADDIQHKRVSDDIESVRSLVIEIAKRSGLEDAHYSKALRDFLRTVRTHAAFRNSRENVLSECSRTLIVTVPELVVASSPSTVSCHVTGVVREGDHVVTDHTLIVDDVTWVRVADGIHSGHWVVAVTRDKFHVLRPPAGPVRPSEPPRGGCEEILKDKFLEIDPRSAVRSLTDHVTTSIHLASNMALSGWNRYDHNPPLVDATETRGAIT
eukprot:c12702_g1_i2.p1 GENE.c12702_g1_i2~~c12702_g1_i2.p1  ORF type:complete len:622 (-),score=183.56 c12702_g1_i2:175-2040(-)